MASSRVIYHTQRCVSRTSNHLKRLHQVGLHTLLALAQQKQQYGSSSTQPDGQPANLSKCREVATHSRAALKASFMSSSHSVSRESTMVAPRPPNVFFPRCVKGMSSSWPHACATYANQECSAAAFTACLRLHWPHSHRV